LSPEEVCWAEVAVDEGRRRREKRHIPLKGRKGAPERLGFAGEPVAKISNPGPKVVEDGVRRQNPGRGDGERVQGGQGSPDRREDRFGVLCHRGRHGLAGFIRLQYEATGGATGEDARKCPTRL